MIGGSMFDFKSPGASWDPHNVVATPQRTWLTTAPQPSCLFMSHLGDSSLCRWLANARSHGDIHGTCCSYCSRSWRELGLSQKLSLAGRLAYHVTTTVSRHHALCLGHPGGRQTHLQDKKRGCYQEKSNWNFYISYSFKLLAFPCHSNAIMLYKQFLPSTITLYECARVCECDCGWRAGVILYSSLFHSLPANMSTVMM